MKVFIKFNEPVLIDLPTAGYIVLSKFRSDAEKYNGFHKLVEDVHIADADFLRSEVLKFDEYIAQLPKNLSDIFKASKTSLYFVMMALENWKAGLRDLLAADRVDEVVFTEMLDQDFYLPFYEAEWEVTKRLQYETYDFISSALYKFLAANYPAVKLTVLKKHSRFKLRKRIFIRRYGLLALKAVLQAGRFLKGIKPSSKTEKDAKPVIFLSRGVAHSQYVVDYVKEFADQSEIYISDGLRTTGKNKAFLTNCNLTEDDYIDSFSDASIATFFSCVISILSILLSYKIRYKEKLRKLDKKYGLAYSSAVTEMIIHSLETHIYISNLERFIKKRAINGGLPKVLISCEIYTQYTYFIAALGAKYNIKTIQLISVAMNAGFLPQYFYCDKALFNQRQILNDFKQNNPALAYKSDYWGNLTFNEHQSERIKKALSEKLTVIFFSQPTIDEENDFAILNCLTALKKEMPLNIVVKPHPREKLEKFSNYKDHITIYPATAALADVITTADLAIVKFSAVEHYLLNYGIPTLYAAFSQIAKNGINNIINSGYEGITFSVPELKEQIVKFPKIADSYKKFRNNEMLKRFENKGIYSFHNNLDAYINE